MECGRDILALHSAGNLVTWPQVCTIRYYSKPSDEQDCVNIKNFSNIPVLNITAFLVKIQDNANRIL